MAVQKGTGFYHVGNFNTNRLVRVQIAADAGSGSNVFKSLMGATETHPFTGKITSPTTNDLVAAARLDAVVRAITVYAIPVAVKIVDVVGSGNTQNGVVVEFETARMGAILGVGDIVDTLGLAGAAAKSKPGIQTLVNSMKAAKSLDGSVLLFAANATLADGTASTAAAVTTLTATII